LEWVIKRHFSSLNVTLIHSDCLIGWASGRYQEIMTARIGVCDNLPETPLHGLLAVFGGDDVVTREILAITLTLSALSVISPPSLAGDSVSVVRHDNSIEHTDNSNRQIASVAPLAVPVQFVPKIPSHVARTAAKSAAVTLGWKKVSFSVPTRVDEAADYCVVTATRLSKAASEKALEVGAWLAALAKQMGSPTTITPSGSTYQHVPVARPQLKALSCQNRLWYMPDGRLKTLTQR
jgi:hypothetical protein